MILVRVRADRSPIEGLGLFAVEPIRAGTPIWTLEPPFDRVLSIADLNSLPAPAQEHIRHFGFLDARSGHWVLNGDLSIFMNHSVTPNTGAPDANGAADLTIALRDIAAGEELTCNYHAFDASPKPVPGA